MAKTGKIYECSKCGAQTPAWEGRCRECGGWGTLQETIATNEKNEQHAFPAVPDSALVDLASVVGEHAKRISIGETEVDRVLGGGLVPGSLLLLGGEPGIGKSTLVLKIIDALSEQGKTSYYISGEESAEQVKLRVDRLGINVARVKFLNGGNIESIVATLRKYKPDMVVVDSIQTMTSESATGEAGSIAQIRAITVRLLEVAKQEHICIVIIGHVTKDGQVAGPKTLEHLVDTVLYLEGDNMHKQRILRSVKNRFGNTNEVGVFVMTAKGLEPAGSAGHIFFTKNPHPLPGTVDTVVWEGSRPFIVELQVLVNKTVFGYPQRTVTGLDTNRVQLLLAVLNQRAKINLGSDDVYVNLSGGLKSKDTALDLAVAAALMSAKKNQALREGTIVFGEVSLTGELKEVSHFSERVREAVQLGFRRIICPTTQKKLMSQKADIVQLSEISGLLDAL